MEDRLAKITISFDNGRTFVLNILPEDVGDFFGNLSAGGKFDWPLNPLADDEDERDFYIDCSKVSFAFVTWPDEEDALDG